MRITSERFEINGREIFFSYREDSIGDKGVIGQIFHGKDYAVHHWRQGMKLIEYHQEKSREKPSLIVDAGANIGCSTVFFAMTFENSFVFSIEPDIMNWHLLEINTKGLNVFNFYGAISDVDGELELIDPGLSDWGYVTQEINGQNAEKKKNVVKSISMKTILGDPSIRDMNPLLVKIDIEGAEEYLFRSDTEWMDAFPLIIIELHDWLYPFSGSSRNFIKALARHDFDFVYGGENIFLFNRRILNS